MKITFLGAGSTVFAKNLLGDCLLAEGLAPFEIALLDIDALPENACVEVPVMVDENGLHPCHVGNIPDQLTGLNMTHIAVHNMVIKAAETLEKKYIYMAAYLDPHTRDELTLDEIQSLCDDLIKAHKGWLPEYC